MNTILATILVAVNAIVGFLIIAASIGLAVFLSNNAHNLDSATAFFGMVVVPIAGIVFAGYLCGMVALLALIEGHSRELREVKTLDYKPQKHRNEPSL